MSGKNAMVKNLEAREQFKKGKGTVRGREVQVYTIKTSRSVQPWRDNGGATPRLVNLPSLSTEKVVNVVISTLQLQSFKLYITAYFPL